MEISQTQVMQITQNR